MQNRHFIIMIVLSCIFIFSFVFTTPLYAVGEIWAWGDNGHGQGQCDVPEPNAGFTVIAAGGWHTLGLKKDGSIVAWGGYNWDGERTVPSPNTDFIAIAAGYIHSLGLKSDGSIVAWGGNGSGQCNVPDPNTGFVAIAANGYHSLGLKNDGSIVAWGRNLEGQCDVPEPNTGFIAVSAGWDHSLGLKEDGTIVTWGANWFGQRDVPFPNMDFTAISAGSGSYSLGLKQDGSIVSWGSNVSGQCEVPSPNTDFVAISAGGGHALGLKKDGSIVAWGDNSAGESNVPSPNTNFTAISAGGGHSIALKKHNIAINKCNITAGKTQGNDSLTISGGIEFPANIFVFYPYDVNHIDVNIISLTDSTSIYTETVNSTVDDNGKFRFLRKIPQGEPVAITSLVIDFRKKTFSMKAKNIDLTGLACPLRLEFTLSDIIIPSGDADEIKVNGKKLIPTRLMNTYKNTLIVNKARTRRNPNKSSSDSFYISGDIAFKNTDVNLCNERIHFTWGQKWFAIPGYNFKAKGRIFKCSSVLTDTQGGAASGIVTALFDLDKAKFTLSVKGVDSIDVDTPKIWFSIYFGDFVEVVGVDHDTGRSW